MTMTFVHLALGIILIIQGFFLWFALAFNGSVGETLVNYSFFTSALLMIVFGVSKIANARWSIAFSLGLGSIILYLPMIWQRFNFSSDIDTTGLYFDVWVILVLLISLMVKPDRKTRINPQ